MKEKAAEGREAARRAGEQVVLCGDLPPPPWADSSGTYRMDPALAPEAPALHGLLRTDCLQPGLWLHRADVRDLRDLTIQEVQGESLRLVVVLDGEVDVSFGPRRLGLGGGRTRRPQAAFVALRRPELFVRRGWRGKHERKVSVGFSREWLAATCPDDDTNLALLQSLFDRHLAIERWTPTPRIVALAEQLIHPPDQPPVLQKLYLESRSIELVAEALRHLTSLALVPPSLGPRERRRIADARSLLDSGAADDLTLEEIARRVGSNPCSLQKQFRSATGQTIFDYLRQNRLLRARQALEQEGRSVGEAADIAGYSSAANFATAFKRHFGITPRQCRESF